MHSVRWVLLSALFLPTLAACGSPERTFGAGRCEAGAEGCACNDDDSCDAGLDCVADECVDRDAGTGGSSGSAAGGTAGTSTGGTAGTGGSAGTSTGGTAGTGGSAGTSTGGTAGTGGSAGTSTGGTAGTGGSAGTSTGGNGGSGGNACEAENDSTFCQRLGRACGDVTDDDNCGDERTISCGGCAGANAYCDEGQCECRVDACEADACGEMDNGCSGTMQCGGCSSYGANAFCDANSCECATNTCGTACGDIDDGCNGTLNCGGCNGANARCVNNECECTRNGCGAACGDIDDGCGGTVHCGGCAAGADCIGNTCVVPKAPITIYDAGGKSGPLGGRAGGDALCQAAIPADRCTKTRVLLSVSASDEIRDMPSNYGVPTDAPLESLNGSKIADDWADLLDGTIDTSLGGAGALVGTSFWYTGSNSNGSMTTETCTGWTTSALADATYGTSSQTSSKWISTSTATCGLSNPPGADYHYLCVCWGQP